MAKVVAVCKSEEKGTRKQAVDEDILKEDYGLVGDVRANMHILRGRIATNEK